jgi:uncharacterized membrane protein
MRTAVATLLIAALVAILSPANAAGLHICNKTVKTVWVAVAWDQTGGQMAATVSWGWIKVEPGACASGQDQALETDGSVVYYASVRDDSGFWNGITSEDKSSGSKNNLAKDTFCAKAVDDFKQIELHSVRNTPPLCDRQTFFLLDTNRQSDYTMMLVAQ